jgi:hypothetical protein
MTTTVSSGAGPDQPPSPSSDLQTSSSISTLSTVAPETSSVSPSAGLTTNRPRVDVAIAGAVSATLTRRGYLTTEWWTTVLGAALSTVLALIGIHGAAAAQAIAIGAPVLLAATYAVSRSMHKSHLAELVADALPQSSQAV